MGDSAQGTQGAGNHDHCIGRVRTAGERRIHALEVVRAYSFLELQSRGKLFGDHYLGVIAQNHVNLVLTRVEIVQQSLGVENAAGSGYGDNYSQIKLFL